MKGEPIEKELLVRLYVYQKRSAAEIAAILGVSTNKVHYWLDRQGIKKRSRSEATYVKRNPNGDPFMFRPPRTMRQAFLLGMCLGLYWGEGTKKNLTSVRLGNTDPRLVSTFVEALTTLYCVKRDKFRFGLQVFSDMRPKQVVRFWSKKLAFPLSHFNKVVVTPARSIGTYRQKTRHGVLTVYVSNKKLRDLLNKQIESL